MKKLTNQKGFTLIELVVVIVILGILAATAAPKFINLQDDANTSVLNAVKASLSSAAILVHSKSLIAGNESSGAAGETVSTNAGTINILYGYPEATELDLKNLLDLDMSDSGTDNDFTFHAISSTTPKTLTIYPQGKEPTSGQAVGDKCSVTYTEASGTGTPVTITLSTATVTKC